MSTTEQAKGLEDLQGEYDRLRDLRDGLKTVATRDERLDAIAEAVRSGKPAQDLWENANARDLKAAGVTRALEQVAAEIVGLVGENHDVPLKGPIPDAGHTLTGEAFTAAVEAAYVATERAREETDDRRQIREAYDRALEKKNLQLMEHERNGGEATSFKPQLTPDEWNALNPAGNFGGMRV